MREIKFRAYIKDESKICEESKPVFSLSELKSKPHKVSNICFDANLVSIDIENANFYFPLDAVELMQYTGLKDKNGVEIYEGDIILSKNYYWGDYFAGDIRGVVKYEESFFYIDGDKMIPDLAAGEDLEVIGNIYQNPELLTPEKKPNE